MLSNVIRRHDMRRALGFVTLSLTMRLFVGAMCLVGLMSTPVYAGQIPTPEMSSTALLGFGLVGVGLWKWWKGRDGR